MKWLSLALLAALALPAVRAQSPAAPLRIVVVEGEAGINNIRTGTARGAVVRVEDQAGAPVEGAAVAFSLPAQGPGGTFPDDVRTLTVTTDAAGLAAMRSLRPNRVPGKFQVRVNASRRGETARADITQFNMTVPNAAKEGGSNKKLIVILAVAGAAAAGGAAAALGGGGGKSAPAPVPAVVPPIVVVPGGTVMGPPQ